jgi:hypothetical protein
MESKTDTFYRYGKVLDKFIDQVRDRIEDDIPSWLDENPYWEIDGDDGRVESCPRTTKADAREDLCESFVREGEDISCGDFFEFVVSEAFNIAMSKNNIFREKKDVPVHNDKTFEKQIIATNRTCSDLMNSILGGRHD